MRSKRAGLDYLQHGERALSRRTLQAAARVEREHALNGYRAAVRDVDAVHGRHGGDGAAGRVLMTETILKVITLTALVAMWVPILDALPFVMLLLSIITVMAIAVLLSR